MFLTRTGAYAAANRFDIFVQTIENLLSKEVANWKNYQSIAPEVANPTISNGDASPASPPTTETPADVPMDAESSPSEEAATNEGA